MVHLSTLTRLTSTNPKWLLVENIRRIGRLKDIVVHDTIDMENPYNYRNKAQYPVGRQKDELCFRTKKI
jgi:tRNA/tmRNA/rRNA uracil-C5-methylase (TrmA/RlmC/RlmD family)